ncbi:MAG: ATP-dependent helicase [Sporichthyaceae bacterium]
MRTAYRLAVSAPPGLDVPALDASQRAVLAHGGGPLLVLAGPGTGKTTTLVEAVAHRVAAGTAPERILVLTFSRKAATELRDRLGARLATVSAAPLASTFHSFAYSLLAEHQHDAEPGRPLRLLSGAEQDVAVRELLRGDGRTDWPEALRVGAGTRGLASEVRDVLSRASERHVDLERLAAAQASAGHLADAAVWAALAGFSAEYLDVLDARGVLDYSELVRRAVAVAESEPARTALRARYEAVFVDEYQDSDPAQVRLLAAIAAGGADLIAFGDPDQAIYSFRGADVRAIADFGSTFRTRAGAPAATAVLSTCRRMSPALLAASRVLASRLPITGLSSAAVRAHRDLTSPPSPAAVHQGISSPGAVSTGLEVRTFPSTGAELEYLADVLRRANLEDGLAWSDMAVLVRSGTRSIPGVRRVLGAAGVPLAVAGDELPLRAEPAVGVLLTALRVAADAAELTDEVARALLLSPLAGIDPTDLRRLGRDLRALAREAGTPPAEVPSSAALIRSALADPAQLVGIAGSVAGSTRRLARLLGASAAGLTAGDTAEMALWRLWSGTPWPRRLAESAAGSGSGARRADGDLDAVCALFATAARAEQQAGYRGVRNFLAELEAQEIPGDPPVHTDRGLDAVRVMTAHRSKGLEWPLVALVGVQEGVWPDLRRRGTLLGADRLGPEGMLAPTPTSATLAEERRLFYVAVTRARTRLLVSAVATPDEDGDRPSRFLRELGVEPMAVRGRPPRPLSAAGLVGELRAVLADPDSAPPLRHAAAERLAALASLRDEGGRPSVPAADPDRWWGVHEATGVDIPVRDPRRPLELSGSAVEGLSSCPLRWFLRREVRADSATGVAMAFGNVVHALAEQVALDPAVDLAELTERLDSVWGQLPFDSAWQSRQQRDAALEALRRFLTWHGSRPDRSLLGVEVAFTVDVDVASGPVRLRGRLDRVEADPSGGIHVVDLKTSKTAVGPTAVAEHAQLGIYQLCVAQGALAELPGAGSEPAGAELVMLRQERGRTGLPKVVAQEPPKQAENPEWIHELLTEAARRIRDEAFTPMPDESCERCEYRRCCSGRPEGRSVVE